MTNNEPNRLLDLMIDRNDPEADLDLLADDANVEELVFRLKTLIDDDDITDLLVADIQAAAFHRLEPKSYCDNCEDYVDETFELDGTDLEVCESCERKLSSFGDDPYDPADYATD